jgi:hypothetical protein
MRNSNLDMILIFELSFKVKWTFSNLKFAKKCT